MLEAEFWKLIDDSRKRAGGDAGSQVDTLRGLLMQLEPNDIVTFDRWFAEFHNQAYTWGLWGAAYVIGGGCSDDGFMDFRGWLISRGQKVFEAALANPDGLAKVVREEDGDCRVEGFQSVAADAWCKKTARGRSEFPVYRSAGGFRTEPDGEAWQEDDVDRLYPKLAKKFS